MTEALRCYQAGAFRACVVLSYIAVFDDLREKLSPLAKVNATAKTIHLAIEKKANGQEVFESDLANQLASARLIDAAHKTKLEIIIQLRNKAAHPSRVNASAEEARFVFFEVIDKFLSEPQLQTTHAADAIIAALPKGNYFPSTQINEIKDTVEADIKTLHDQAAPYLVHKLVELRDSGDSTAKNVARSYLMGLASLKSPLFRAPLQKTVVIGKGQDSDYAAVIIALLRVDPALADNLANVASKRIVSLLKSAIAETSAEKPLTRLAHPLGWLRSFIEVHGQEKIWTEYQSVVESLIEKYMYDSSLMSIITDDGPIHEAYYTAFEQEVRSSDYNRQNRAAKALPGLDEELGDSLSPEKALRLIAAVTKAADGNAFSAIDVRDAKFKAVPQLRKQAAKYALKSPVKSQKLLDELHLTTTVKKFASLLT